MWRTIRWFCVFFLLSALMVFSAGAENVPLQKVTNNQDAQLALKKMQSAARQLNYSGTFVYQQSNQIRTSRITHLFSENNELEKLEILDGQPREYIRSNDNVACYMPETKTVLHEKRFARDVFPAILAANAAQLTDHYDIRMGEGGRVAGHDCQEVILEPKDKLRYGYRLWSDKLSGLLLRAQTFDAKNEVVEQISFAQIEIGRIDPSRVKTSFFNVDGWHVESAVIAPINLSKWSVTVPPGFKKTKELRRFISDGKKTTATSAEGIPVVAAPREVSQIVFSDGLAAISVFIEPGSRSRTEGAVRQGAMNMVGRRYADFWVTVMGEVPSTTIRQVSDSIELKSN